MNEKKVTIITIVCLVLILLAGGGAIYYLQFVELDEQEKILAGWRQQVFDAEMKKSQIPVLLKDIEKLEKKEKELIQQIPNLDKKEYDAFADLLDDLRRQAGVSVSRANWVTPQRPAPVPGRPQRTQPASIHKVQYDLTVTGSFYQLLRYVNLLEQQRRFIGIQDFTVGKGQEEVRASAGARATAPRRDLKITIYSYTYKQPPQPIVIDAAGSESGQTTAIPD